MTELLSTHKFNWLLCAFTLTEGMTWMYVLSPDNSSDLIIRLLQFPILHVAFGGKQDLCYIPKNRGKYWVVKVDISAHRASFFVLSANFCSQIIDAAASFPHSLRWLSKTFEVAFDDLYILGQNTTALISNGSTPSKSLKISNCPFLCVTVVSTHLLDVSVQELFRRLQCCICEGS